MANNPISCFASHPSMDIKHAFVQSANVILAKDNHGMERNIAGARFRR
jgi:hypothetical protein